MRGLDARAGGRDEPMNPFDWAGPQFLLFYLAFGIGLLSVLGRRRHGREDGEIPRIDVSDPYLIATLREGPEEALKVAVVQLVHRGLLAADGTKVTLANSNARWAVSHPLEKAVVSFFERGGETKDLLKDAPTLAAAKASEGELTRVELLPSREMRDQRVRDAMSGCLILGGVAATKIGIALARGRRNIGFLIVLWLLFSVGVWVVTHPRLTSRGKALVKDLQTLFGRLKEDATGARLKASATELALLCAVFGLAAAPAAEFAFVQTLFPRPASTTSGCGSSCGSSCGGGCGGGCGGCGS